MTENERITKLVVNLIQSAVRWLNYATIETGYSQTDTVNRALQVYGHIVQIEKEGKLLFVEDIATGTRERLIIL